MPTWALTDSSSQDYDAAHLPATDAQTATKVVLKGWWKPTLEDKLIVEVEYQTSGGVGIRSFTVEITGAAWDKLKMTPIPASKVADDVRGLTATGGSTTTITKTGAGWTVDNLITKIVTVSEGPNAGLSRVVTDNTEDTITFAAMTNANNNATVFDVVADLCLLWENNVLAYAMDVAELPGAIA